MTDTTTTLQDLGLQAAVHIIQGCVVKGLPVEASILAVETVVATVISYVATTACHRACQIPFATAALDDMTERAHDRVVAVLQAFPHDP